MPSKRKQKVKKRLKKELLSVRKYKTTYKDIKKYFRLINDNVFSGKLSPFNDINIMYMNRKKYVAQVLILQWKRKGTNQFNLEIKKEIEKAEKEIKIIKLSSIEDINKIAIETSSEIVRKIMSTEVNASSVSAIVEDISKKKLQQNIHSIFQMLPFKGNAGPY